MPLRLLAGCARRAGRPAESGVCPQSALGTRHSRTRLSTGIERLSPGMNVPASPLIDVVTLASYLTGHAPPPGAEGYQAGHLPRAVFVDLDRDLAGPPGAGARHPLPATPRANGRRVLRVRRYRRARGACSRAGGGARCAVRRFLVGLDHRSSPTGRHRTGSRLAIGATCRTRRRCPNVDLVLLRQPGDAGDRSAVPWPGGVSCWRSAQPPAARRVRPQS